MRFHVLVFVFAFSGAFQKIFAKITAYVDLWALPGPPVFVLASSRTAYGLVQPVPLRHRHALSHAVG